MEKEIRDMNVKELKALAKERGIKRYYSFVLCLAFSSSAVAPAPLSCVSTPECGNLTARDPRLCFCVERLTGIFKSELTPILIKVVAFFSLLL